MISQQLGLKRSELRKDRACSFVHYDHCEITSIALQHKKRVSGHADSTTWTSATISRTASTRTSQRCTDSPSTSKLAPLRRPACYQAGPQTFQPFPLIWWASQPASAMLQLPHTLATPTSTSGTLCYLMFIIQSVQRHPAHRLYSCRFRYTALVFALH